MPAINTTKTTIRALLVQRGLRWKDVAEKAGITEVTAQMTGNGTYGSNRARRRLELVLGPIWTAPDEFVRLGRIAAAIGMDPVLSTAADLYAWVRTHLALCPVPTHRADLLAAIERHLSEAQPQTANAQDR